MDLIQHLMENRLGHARGPVHHHWVHYMNTKQIRFSYLQCRRNLRKKKLFTWKFLLVTNPGRLKLFLRCKETFHLNWEKLQNRLKIEECEFPHVSRNLPLPVENISFVMHSLKMKTSMVRTKYKDWARCFGFGQNQGTLIDDRYWWKIKLLRLL